MDRSDKTKASSEFLLPPGYATPHEDPLETTRFLLQKTSLAATRSGNNPVQTRGDTPYSASATPNQTAPSSPRLVPRAQTLSVPGVTTSRISPNGAIVQTASKLVIVMVGLPARGKSYIVKKLARYFTWSGHNCRIFNCGDRRRQHANNSSQDADFFDNKNVEAQTLREQLAAQTLESLIKWIISDNGTVGIFDATNSTRKRRKAIMERIHKEDDLKVLFIESICTDTELLEANMRLKLQGPDYKNKDPVEALADFKARVRNYEAAYETIGEVEEANDESFVQIINVGKKIVSHNIEGFLAGQAVFFLLNLNLAERLIFVTRHGESEHNVVGKLGGDAPLTPRGRKYSAALSRLIDQERHKFRQHQLDQWSYHPRTIPEPDDHWTANPQPRENYYLSDPPPEKAFSVWTSSLVRSKQTAVDFDEDIYDVKEFKIMDEIDSGICEGLTYKEIEAQLPEEYHARRKNKLFYRYPGGESYLDVVYRLSPVVVEVERAKHHILIISHRVISRILLSYFLNLTQAEATEIEIPLEVCYCIVPRSYGADLCKYSWDEESDTFVEEVITGGMQAVHFAGLRR